MSGPAGPAPPAGAGPGPGPDLPDLSHLTEEERSIILSVMERQKKEEEKEQSMLKWNLLSGFGQLVNNVAANVSEVLQVKSPTDDESQTKLHQQFEMYKDQVKKLGEEPPVAQTARAESQTCDICQKTKFADGCGRACCYCQSRFCARCGGRVSLRANKVMWVCNVCRRKQEILTRSGEFHSNMTLLSDDHTSHGVPQPPMQGSPGATGPLSNGATERRRSPSGSYYDGGGGRMPRSPSDLSLDYSDHLPHGCHGNGEENLRARRRPIRDRRGRWHSQDHPLDRGLDERELRRRQEEEFQARYRSDPNLARYPVKPQPSEEAMRMLAQVGRVRHQRRHSDVSLATAEPNHLTLRHTVVRQNRPQGLVGSEGQRSFSMDRPANHISPTSPRRSPLPQQHLDPSSAHKRKPANDSTVLRGRGMGKMRVIGSFSSSEEELVTTPEYTSCDEPDSDQVLEWNGRVLQGASFNEVYNIILDSKPEPQVELVVSRPIGEISRTADSSHIQLDSSSSSFDSQKVGPSISVTSPMSPSVLSGQVSVKLWYDKVGHQLIVTVLGAKELPAQDDGRPRNPYVKIYFLPDRSDKSKRRTKTIKKSVEPRWNQTFMYSPVHRREFRERMLELTVWDQARVREEESQFMGEVLIELESALLDDQSHWYKLQLHDVSSLPLPSASPYLQRRGLQPEPSPTSRRLQRSQRISDSEFSDYDCEDGIGVISDYKQNGRDFHSSTLSVPEQVMSTNHSRADMVRMRSRSPSQPPPQSGNPLYPLYREDAVRLLRGTKLSRAYSDAGQYSSLESQDFIPDFPYEPDAYDEELLSDITPLTTFVSHYFFSGRILMVDRTRRAHQERQSVAAEFASYPSSRPKELLTESQTDAQQHLEEPEKASQSQVDLMLRDSLSFKSSDSDVSDVSAMSNASDTRSVRTIRPAPASAAPLTKSSSVGGEICSLGRNNDDDDDEKKRRSSFGARMMGMVGLGKKSQSASQLNPEVEEKKKKVVRLPVQRSVETGLAIEFKARFTRQPSRDPDAEDPKPGAYELVVPFFNLSLLLLWFFIFV
ncbi:hypothetical protein F2P81_022916 [Scophthalmus maximus]|uniref:Regulating synaptic membrane exocytosis protein 2-like n=1 Tax=Scophthalmus maximus TaxID=52904 RepID=A0A6A4S0R2_SCOMX|nr:hypothetical protein F2P81_022916 [Scophthalmus maximus]